MCKRHAIEEEEEDEQKIFLEDLRMEQMEQM